MIGYNTSNRASVSWVWRLLRRDCIREQECKAGQKKTQRKGWNARHVSSQIRLRTGC